MQPENPTPEVPPQQPPQNSIYPPVPADHQAPAYTPSPQQEAQQYQAYNNAPQQTMQPTHKADPTTIVLQWLTYAFWGWTILGLSVLTTSVIFSLTKNSDSNNFTSYGIAAVLVLLPISFICDTIYSKREPVKKVGAEMVVMVIHTVIFALFGIGSLIWAAISIVTLITSSSDSTTSAVSLASSLIVTVFYAVTFLRTLNPSKLTWVQRYYKWLMLVTVGVIALLGLIGPVAKERSTKDDRLIQENIPSVSTAINSYAQRNKTLPTDLSSISLNGDAKKLIDKNLVTYKSEGSVTSTSRSYSSSTYSTSNTSFKYQLCVTYKKSTEDNNSYSSYNSLDKDGYSTYISAYSHPAGNVCYKIKDTTY